MPDSAVSDSTASARATRDPNLYSIAAGAPRPLRCLLVEDSRFDRSLVRYSADRGGVAIDFVEVRTLARARECLEEEQFDLVMLDRRLPDGDALDASAELASGTRNADVPMIILGQDVDDLGAALHRGGHIGFISKQDLSPERLTRTVRQVLVGKAGEPGERAASDPGVPLGALSDGPRLMRIRPLCSRLMTVVSELRRSPMALSDPAAAAALEELSELCLMLWIDLDGACGDTPAGRMRSRRRGS